MGVNHKSETLSKILQQYSLNLFRKLDCWSLFRDGGNSALEIGFQARPNLGPQKRFIYRHVRALKIALTKAQLLKHDLHFHGYFRGISGISLRFSRIFSHHFRGVCDYFRGVGRYSFSPRNSFPELRRKFREFGGHYGNQAIGDLECYDVPLLRNKVLWRGLKSRKFPKVGV